ncbi:hypothetical protein KCU78_g3911, partial [Aureobasidium melanogenum]
MREFPPELVLRTIDFVRDDDLPALRATCTALESFTRPRFITAFIAAPKFPADIDGIQKLEHLITHSRLGGEVKGCIAMGSDALGKPTVLTALMLKKIFDKITSNGHALHIGLCLSAKQSYQSHSDSRQHQDEQHALLRFGVVMVGATRAAHHLRSFTIDTHQSTQMGALVIWSYYREMVHLALHRQTSNDIRDITFSVRDRRIFGGHWAHIHVTKKGACIEYCNIHRGVLTSEIAEVWRGLLPIQELRIVDCKLYFEDLLLLIESVKSLRWTLTLSSVCIITAGGWTKGYTTWFKDALLGKTPQLHMMSLAGLVAIDRFDAIDPFTTTNNTPIITHNVKAVGDEDIHNLMGGLEFVEVSDADEYEDEDTDEEEEEEE